MKRRGPSAGTSRRRFVQAAGLAGLAGVAADPILSAALRRDEEPSRGLKLGVASYSLRAFPRREALDMIESLGVRHVNFKSFHLAYDATAEEHSAARTDLAARGLLLAGGGTVYLQQDEDEHIRLHFEYARRAGMPLLVIAPTARTLPRIERFVADYDIAVAIHNHGPEDPHFPAPADALRLIRDMDPRVGVCVDVGHTARTGGDVVRAIEESGDRLLDLHMKDLRDLRVKETQCIVGDGAMPVAAIFAQLLAMNYSGCVNLEYEIDKEEPLPGMKQSMAYMRGVLAGLLERQA